MNNKQFKLWNRIVALLMLVVSAAVYLLTVEPTASFWDCGEFIASSYKLEVGHPPGNPVFQLFARLFTIFTGPESAALAVNAFSAICSAFTIFFLYLTIVFFAKRLFKPSKDGNYSIGTAIAIFGSGAVGALVYTFTDTFWFSAVEGEVYAMSSLITALVFWAMTKWYDQADQPHSARWIVLISFLMGLSIGIHLLNLLAIPALVFLFYYKKRENGHYSFLEYLKISLISIVILAVILFGIIPYLPQAAAYVDLLFVNVFGLPFNSGAAAFMILLLALCFWGIYYTMKRKKVLLNTLLLCFTMIVIGFSMFSIVIIRSSAKTPTNEYQPDNPFTLIRYLGREQYGSNPLIYGQYFDAEWEPEEAKYWAPMGDKYIQADGPGEQIYKSEDKMFFPRMWSSSHKREYASYMQDGGLVVSGDDVSYRKPTFAENMKFFFDYQMNWMYWRYFMWNFAGRQNDIHSPSPGDPFVGNWESGISFLDEPRLGDQSDAPDYLKNNKGKNHYYMLPLLLGIVGIFFQFARDKRGSWVTFLMFFMTGIAIVLYLNQPPLQVRERDYAYAGSFYSFSIWIGLAVAAIYSLIKDNVKLACRGKMVVASVTVAATLGVPVLMAVENWDDHDRSNRYTAVEMAKNYLNSVGKNGILVTHGDNDTFPLWYAQEVEGIRPDVRIANTSLLGTDWHIDQMKWATNKSAPLKLSLGPESYLYGTNDGLYLMPVKEDSVFLAKDLVAHFNDSKNTLMLVKFDIRDNKRDFSEAETPHTFIRHRKDRDLRTSILMDERYQLLVNEYKLSKENIVIKESQDLGMYVPTKYFKIPVNKENIIKHGILDAKYFDAKYLEEHKLDSIPDEIILTIDPQKEKRQYIEKAELFMIDLLANYDWSRPLNLLSVGGNLCVGIKDYLMYDGFSYRFVPVKNNDRYEWFVDPDDLYHKMKNVYTWDALKRKDYFVDYQNFYTFCGVLSQRSIFINVAEEMKAAGQPKKAVEMLDKCMECVPEENFPLEISYLGFSNEYMILAMSRLYFELGERQKAEALLRRMRSAMLKSHNFFNKFEDVNAKDVATRLKMLLNRSAMILHNELDKMDTKTEKDRALDYLNQCQSALVLNFYDYDELLETWDIQEVLDVLNVSENQIQCYLKFELKAEATKFATLVLNKWIISTKKAIKEYKGAYAAAQKEAAEHDSYVSQWQRLRSKPNPPRRQMEMLVRKAKSCESRYLIYHKEMQRLNPIMECNMSYMGNVLYILNEASMTDIVEKYTKEFTALQKEISALYGEEE